MKLDWSCDEKDRESCRNPHGCHCREITDLLERIRGKEALVAATLRVVRRLEKQTRGHQQEKHK
jgi:hypothetical protein